LLNFNYQSKFYGQDVLKNDYQPRALIATYQNLGLIKNNILTIISPKQKVEQFSLSVINNPKLSADFQLFFDEKPMQKLDNTLVKETISYYQTASEMLTKKRYNNTVEKK